MRFEYYEDNKGEWRWRLVSSNGRIIGDSAEGYVNEKHCVEMISRIQLNVNTARVIKVVKEQTESND